MAHVLGYLISFLIEGITLWYYGSLFEEKRSIINRIISLIVFYSILFFVAIFDIKWLNAILYILFNFVFLFYNYRLKWFTSFFNSLLITALMSMCELGIYAFMERFIAPHFFEQTESFFITGLFVILSKFSFLVFIFIIVSIGKIMHSKEETSKISLLYMFLPISSIISMIILIYILENCETSNSIQILIFASSVLMMTSNILIFTINIYTQHKLKEFYELKLLSVKDKNREDYYRALNTQIESQRILVHDLKNHLRSILQLNAEEQHAEIDSYINNLLISKGMANPVIVSDSEMFNSILLSYSQKCEAKNISFSTDIRSKVIDFLPYTDLTSLFGNLLDNATEAAEKVDSDPFIDLSIGSKEGSNYVYINMVNSCQFIKDSDKRNMFSTSKINKNDHGLGLKSIHTIIDKYNGNIEMHIENEGSEFHTNIILEYPNKI